MTINWTCTLCDTSVECHDVRVFQAINESHVCDTKAVATKMNAATDEIDRLNEARGRDTETIQELADRWRAKSHPIHEGRYVACADELLAAFGVTPEQPS